MLRICVDGNSADEHWRFWDAGGGTRFSAGNGEAGVSWAALGGEDGGLVWDVGVCEGKMPGLFSMLFGPGAILMTSQAEARVRALGRRIYWLRRSMWLVLLGALHAHLVWGGDIL